MRSASRWFLAGAGFLVAGVAGCGSPSPTSGGSPTSGASLSPAGPRGLHVGLATPGAPNPADPAFLQDQDGLYDPAQFGDPQLYPPGYHWRIDKALQPADVRSAVVGFSSAVNAWAVDVTFTPKGALRFQADSQAAYNGQPGHPENRIAFFVGSRVVSTPGVQSPSSRETEITDGGLSKPEAEALAAMIGGP